MVSLALSQDVTDEELGGWEVHAKITGNADRTAEDEQDCFRIIKQFLSYMPSHRDQLPPLAEVPEGFRVRACPTFWTCCPREETGPTT